MKTCIYSGLKLCRGVPLHTLCTFAFNSRQRVRYYSKMKDNTEPIIREGKRVRSEAKNIDGDPKTGRLNTSGINVLVRRIFF